MSKYIFKSNIEVHYPITVMSRKFSGVSTLNQQLFDLVENLEAQFKNTSKNAVNSEQITTQGGFQTPLSTNIFQINQGCLEEFKNEMVLPAVKEYLNEVFKEEACKIDPYLVGWANILQEGDWQRPHMHPTQTTLVSGVYYINVPEMQDKSEGHLEFINPMPISINHGFSNTSRVKPEAGKLMLFPPFYMHYVHPSKQQQKRAVIAFDVLSQNPNPQFVF